MNKNASKLDTIQKRTGPSNPTTRPSRNLSLTAEKEFSKKRFLSYAAKKENDPLPLPPRLSVSSRLNTASFYASTSNTLPTPSQIPLPSTLPPTRLLDSQLHPIPVKHENIFNSSNPPPIQRFLTYVQSFVGSEYEQDLSNDQKRQSRNETTTNSKIPPWLASMREKVTKYWSGFPQHAFFLFSPWHPIPEPNRPAQYPLPEFFEVRGLLQKWYPTPVPRKIFYRLLVPLLLFLFLLPIILYFAGGEGPQSSSFRAAALEQCKKADMCKNSGQSILDVDNMCACKCQSEHFGASCEKQLNCPCITSSGTGLNSEGCLALFPVYSDLYDSEIESFKLFTLDPVQLAFAFNMSKHTCEDQKALLRILQSTASNWAKVAVAHHFQVSANYSAAQYLAEQFQTQWESKSSKPIPLNGLIYRLSQKQITFEDSASTQTDRFTRISSKAKALSKLRQHYLQLLWTEYLDLPQDLLNSFLDTTAKQPIMLHFDTWKEVSNSTFLDSLFASGSYGSPFCTPLSLSTLGTLNLAMEKAFGFSPFANKTAALQGCYQRPTLGVYNVWRLRTGNYPSRDMQQALVLTDSMKELATITAVPLESIESKDELGVPGHMNHVWVNYFMNFPKDLDLRSIFTQYVAGGTLTNLNPPLLNAQLWGNEGVLLDPAHIKHAIASLYIRTNIRGNERNPYFGTALAQSFRSFLNTSGIPLYWSSDALQESSYLDTNDNAFKSLWTSASKNESMDEIWNKMTPKVQIF